MLAELNSSDGITSLALLVQHISRFKEVAVAKKRNVLRISVYQTHISALP